MLNQKQLGEKIRELRKKLGFTQDFVARTLEIGRQALLAIEAGKRKIDTYELLKLAGLFGVEIKELLSGKISISNFNDAILECRKNEYLSEKGKEGLIKFQKICKDFEYLKRI